MAEDWPMVSITDFSSTMATYWSTTVSDGISNMEREMIPHRAVLTIPKTEAETQRALFADLPDLSPREQAMMAIYDAVIAGEKIVKLQEIFNSGDIYRMVDKPKVVLAPATAESVTYTRTTARRRRKDDLRVSSAFTAGKWELKLTEDMAVDTFSTRVTEVTATALAPLIPPPHRGTTEDGDLLLWEPVWLHSKEVVVNADPAILRPLSHGLYRVIAAWDLTPVESMMLSE